MIGPIKSTNHLFDLTHGIAEENITWKYYFRVRNNEAKNKLEMWVFLLTLDFASKNQLATKILKESNNCERPLKLLPSYWRFLKQLKDAGNLFFSSQKHTSQFMKCAGNQGTIALKMQRAQLQ